MTHSRPASLRYILGSAAVLAAAAGAVALGALPAGGATPSGRAPALSAAQLAPDTSDEGEPGMPDLPTVPCALEDSPGPCFWDAGMRSNGRGFSFWRDDTGRTFYLDPQATAWRPFRDVEGHHRCMILVGETSRVRCADGWETES